MRSTDLLLLLALAASGGASPQAACQAEVDAARLRPQKRPLDADNLAYLNPYGRLVDCGGTEALDALLVEELAPTESFAGTEDPRIVFVNRPFGFHLLVETERRRQGRERGAFQDVVGLWSWKRGTRADVGIFQVGRRSPGDEPEVEWHPDRARILHTGRRYPGLDPDVFVTDAPWVKTRLDDGELYLGQFAEGRPHGFGLRLAPEHRVGRLGFFKEGLPHGFLYIWETWTARVRSHREPPENLSPASYEWGRLVQYDEGLPEAAYFVVHGISDSLVGADGQPLERRHKVDVGIPTLSKALARKELEAGAVVAMDGKFYALEHDYEDGSDLGLYGTKRTVGRNRYWIVPEGQPVYVEGYGAYANSAAAREDLEALVRRKARPNYRGNWYNLRRGDMVTFEGDPWIALDDGGPDKVRVRLAGPAGYQRVESGARILPLDYTGGREVWAVGRVVDTPEGRRHALEAMQKAADEMVASRARIAAQQKADLDRATAAWAREVNRGVRPWAAPGGASEFVDRSPRAAPAPSGPLVGSEAWHRRRALITHPESYFQNSYSY